MSDTNSCEGLKVDTITSQFGLQQLTNQHIQQQVLPPRVLI